MTESVLLLWAIGLLGVALVCVVAEMFLPTGGLGGILGAAAAIGAIVFFFKVSPTWGALGTLFVLFAAPTCLWMAIKIYPNTPVGRRMILSNDEEALAAQRIARAEEEERIRETLVGARGVAQSDLRPVGMVSIEGERVEALAEGGVIEAGSSVRVTSIEGNRLRVRRDV